jgi:hypothetical protein
MEASTWMGDHQGRPPAPPIRPMDWLYGASTKMYNNIIIISVSCKRSFDLSGLSLTVYELHVQNVGRYIGAAAAERIWHLQSPAGCWILFYVSPKFSVFTLLLMRYTVLEIDRPEVQKWCCPLGGAAYKNWHRSSIGQLYGSLLVVNTVFLAICYTAFNL